MCISDDSGRDVFGTAGTICRTSTSTRSSGPSYRSADTKKLVATVVVVPIIYIPVALQYLVPPVLILNTGAKLAQARPGSILLVLVVLM